MHARPTPEPYTGDTQPDPPASATPPAAPRPRLQRSHAMNEEELRRYFFDEDAEVIDVDSDDHADEEAAATLSHFHSPPASQDPDDSPMPGHAADARSPSPLPPNKKSMQDSKYDRWCFTLNNPGAYRLPQCTDVAYAVYQLESGKKGTPHLQGYVRFTTRLRLTAIRKLWRPPMNKAHWQPCKGTEQQNYNYCTKEEGHLEGPWFINERAFKPSAGQQGHRSDLDAVVTDIQNRLPIHEIAENHPHQFLRYSKGIRELHQELSRDRTFLMTPRDVRVFVLWGPTNTGKTHRIRSNFPGLYEVNPGRDPWGKYNGEQVILFDEFDPSRWPIRDMLRYLDKWPCSLDARYNNNFAAWSTVYLTANEPPSSWWMAEQPKVRNAFLRRILQVQHVLRREDDPLFNAVTDCYTQPVQFIPD